MANYEYTFEPDTPNNTAASVYRLVRPGGPRVLDLGSGPGVVASYLANHDDKIVTCLDTSRESLVAARERGVGEVIDADLSDPAWAKRLNGGRFDVIVMADVLEHLVDPGSVLETIVASSLLEDNGYLVISIPNAGHEAVLAELINGRFTYQDTGLLDSTHLRFFTLASLRELLEQSGFFITQIERTHRTAQQTSLAVHDVVLPTDLRDRILEASAEAQTYQFIVKAAPADATRELADVRKELSRTAAALAEAQRLSESAEGDAMAAVRDVAVAEVAALRRQQLELEAAAAETRHDNASLQQRLIELEAALAREQKLTASERKRYERALAAASRQASTNDLKTASDEIALLKKRLADVYQSRTWKTGRAASSAYHLPVRAMRKMWRRPVSESSPAAPLSTGPPTDRPHEYTLVEDAVMRRKYEEALSRVAFSGSGKAVAVAVYTTDLSKGRGDVYTAVGLGRRLAEIGYEVVYLPQDRWYDPPDGTELYVAMLETVDVTRLPPEVKTIAWVRNQTAVWVEQPWLALYDMVLASSSESLDALQMVYPGRTGLLPIGVDTELFKPTAHPTTRHGVVTTVNQWGKEREVFSHLKERPPGFQLALFGEQRGIAPQLTPYAKGPVSFFALPSLYSQAQIVLDDFNHTTAGYGNVNSRLFEAAACGAVVMTNRANGLAALGLQDVSVFSSAGDLFGLVERHLDSGAAAAVAEGLQELVRGRHSYRSRAADFDTLVAELDQTPATPAEGRVVVSYFPDYRDNPYLEMMWSDLRDQRSVAIPVSNDLSFTATVRAAAYRRTVFHLNWTAPVLGGAADEPDRLVRYRRFLEAIDEMHSRGIPSIWTVHNAMPHESADLELEAQLRQQIADRVDLVHVMCDETVAACAEWFEIPQSKVRVIPHPSYIDVYPNLVDKETARDRLGLGADDFVYLHFGQIRPYKGIDKLLDAFDQVSRQDPAAKLLLVGKPGRFEEVRHIIDRARANPNVISNFNPVLDADVQLYMNAADVAVLPHQTALNSGALLLAYSFARPVIASANGCMAGLVDSETGVLFDWADSGQALLNALLEGRDLGPSHGRAAYERAREVHYLEIGKRFTALVDEAFELRG